MCLLDLLMGIEALQSPLLDLLLDTLQQLCHLQPVAKPKPVANKTRRQAFLAGPDPSAVLLPAYSRYCCSNDVVSVKVCTALIMPVLAHGQCPA